MVYVASDGTICENPPWSFNRLLTIFYGAVTFIILFFKSLVGLDGSSKSYSSSSSGRSSHKGGWGGGGGGGFGSGGGGGRPNGGSGGGGRFMTMRDIRPPTVGGCAGGSCGM